MHTHNTASRRVRWEGKRVTRCDKLLLEMCFVFFTSVNLCTLVSYVFWAPKSASLSKQYVRKRCYSCTRKVKRTHPRWVPGFFRRSYTLFTWRSISEKKNNISLIYHEKRRKRYRSSSKWKRNDNKIKEQRGCVCVK